MVEYRTLSEPENTPVIVSKFYSQAGSYKVLAQGKGKMAHKRSSIY